MKYRLWHSNNVTFFLWLLLFLFSVVTMVTLIAMMYLYERFLKDIVFAIVILLPWMGYVVVKFFKGWKYYFSFISITTDGVSLSNKTEILFEGSWPEITQIYFLAHIVKGWDVVTMYFSKDTEKINPQNLGSKWRMSGTFIYSVIEAEKVQEVLKHCPREKIVWGLEKNCPQERFEKYGIYHFNYKL